MFIQIGRLVGFADRTCVGGIIVLFWLFVTGAAGSTMSSAAKPENCSTAIQMTLDSAYSGESWALEMLDASAKPVTGMLRQGFMYQHVLDPEPDVFFHGNYDQCLDVMTTKDFGTLYCRVNVRVSQIGPVHFSIPKVLYLDICVPDICTGDDLVPILQSYIKDIPNIITATVNDSSCHEKQRPLTPRAIAAICVLLILLALAVSATVYDLIFKQDILESLGVSGYIGVATPISSVNESTNNSQDVTEEHSKNGVRLNKPCTDNTVRQSRIGKTGIADQLLMPWSLYTNISNLLSTSQSKGHLTCINGIRLIAMTWIIVGHFIFFAGLVMDNAESYRKASIRRWYFQPLLRFSTQVDTLFVISGLLTTYKAMNELQTRKPSSDYFKRRLIHRFLRLTPPHVLVLMTNVALLKHISNGPFWPQGESEKNGCNDYWWTSLLFIQNFLKFDEMCMLWTWSLGNEMQYFFISPLILLPLYYFDWLGLLAPATMLLGSVLFTGSVSYAHNLIPIDEPNYTLLVEYFDNYYCNPICRIGPYLIGMVTGYLLYKTKCKAKMSKIVVGLGWVVFAASLFGVYAAVYGHQNGDRLSNEMASLYNALHRIVWGCCVAWVIFACICGYGGIVNRILSWKALMPITCLSYCIYLVHPLVIVYYFLSQRRFFYVNNINLVVSFLGILVVTSGVSLVAYLLFEAPFANLERTISRTKHSEKTKIH